jgi:hypothetical protein
MKGVGGGQRAAGIGQRYREGQRTDGGRRVEYEGFFLTIGFRFFSCYPTSTDVCSLFPKNTLPIPCTFFSKIIA